MRASIRLTVVFALSVVLLPTADASAQLAVIAGFSSADVSFSPTGPRPDGPIPERRRGFVAGISLLAPTARIGGYQIELLVHRIGSTGLVTAGDRIQLTYLEVPAMLHVDVARRGRNAGYIVIGPTLSWNLAASYDDRTTAVGIRDDIKTIDVGVTVGGGVEFHRLVVGARYTWGLMNPFRDGDSTGSFMNLTWLVTVGLRFDSKSVPR